MASVNFSRQGQHVESTDYDREKHAAAIAAQRMNPAAPSNELAKELCTRSPIRLPQTPEHPAYTIRRGKTIWYRVKPPSRRTSYRPTRPLEAAGRPEISGNEIALGKSGWRDKKMMIAGALAVLVVFCLLLSVVQTPPAIGR